VFGVGYLKTFSVACCGSSEGGRESEYGDGYCYDGKKSERESEMSLPSW
jgi:hypothetical protein